MSSEEELGREEEAPEELTLTGHVSTTLGELTKRNFTGKLNSGGDPFLEPGIGVHWSPHPGHPP